MSGLLVEIQTPGLQPNSTRTGWKGLQPDLRAAILISPAIVLIELFSSLAPVVGYTVTFPIALAAYLVQGFLVGRLAKNQGLVRPLSVMGLGGVSGVWTGVLLSNAVTLIVFLVATPVSLGAFLLGFPAVLAGSLLDIALNIIISALGAWLYARIGGLWAAGISCFLGVAGGAFSCGLLTFLLVIAIRYISTKVH
jgi:hypothetical protein